MCDESTSDHKMDFSEDKVCDIKIEADGIEYDGDDDHDNNLDEYTEFEIKTEITIDQVQLFKDGEHIKNETSIADPSIEDDEFVCAVNRSVCTSTIGDEPHREGVDYVAKSCNNSLNVLTEKDFENQVDSKRTWMHCSVPFSSSDELIMHNSKYSIKNTYTCNLCGISKKTRREIEYHQIFNHCSVCNWSFQLFREMKKHVLTEHAQVTKYFCTYCNVMFDSSDQKNSHMTLEHGNMISIQKCEVCYKDIPFRSDLTYKRHLLLHRVREEAIPTKAANGAVDFNHTRKTIINIQTSYRSSKFLQVIDKSIDLDILSSNVHGWICMLCHSVCDDKESFDLHLNKQHKVSSETGLHCKKCDLKFKSKENLQEHRDFVHNGRSSIKLRKSRENKRLTNDEKGCCITTIKLKSIEAQENYTEFKKASRYNGRWHCQLCPYKTKNTKMHEFYFDQHLKKIHGVCNPEQRYLERECPHCHSKFYTKKSLNIHMKQMHFYPCSECDKTFHSQDGLSVHLIYHKEQADIESTRSAGSSNCTICGNVYYSDKDLKEHSVIHSTQSDPHTCYMCGISYYCASDLTSHLLDVHCPICNKIFICHDDVQQHVKLQHPTDLRCTCYECGMTFETLDALQIHMSRNHEGNELKLLLFKRIS